MHNYCLRPHCHFSATNTADVKAKPDISLTTAALELIHRAGESQMNKSRMWLTGKPTDRLILGFSVLIYIILDTLCVLSTRIKI